MVGLLIENSSADELNYAVAILIFNKFSFLMPFKIQILTTAEHPSPK
jgi:hypothetical protein